MNDIVTVFVDGEFRSRRIIRAQNGSKPARIRFMGNLSRARRVFRPTSSGTALFGPAALRCLVNVEPMRARERQQPWRARVPRRLV
jgi:hypothetical protein